MANEKRDSSKIYIKIKMGGGKTAMESVCTCCAADEN